MNFKLAILAGIFFTSIILPRPVLSQAVTASPQPIAIQQFSAPAGGQQVTPNLPIYKVHIANGKLLDDSNNVFNSFQSQTTTPIADSECAVRNLNWLAYYTTFYVAYKNDDNLYLVKSCGKSPLQLNSTQQYPAINANNFINHAQIAGTTGNGTTREVIAAGEVDVVDGKIVYMDTCSGHFKPNAGSFLAYLSLLDNASFMTLTTELKNIIKSGWITDQQINSNLTFMKPNTDPKPKRNERSGTGDCNSYTTVFDYSLINGTTTLFGGLMGYQQGNINVFQSTINAITNKNIKGIKLTNSVGIYSYEVYVTTDWHFWNDALQFYFTDETDDTYGLSVHVYMYDHEVSFNSTAPNIKTIVFY